MSPVSRLSTVVLLIHAVSAAVPKIVPPAFGGAFRLLHNVLALEDTSTDYHTITTTLRAVNQKSGANDNVPPNQPVAETSVTALDGQLLHASVSSISASTYTAPNVTQAVNRRYLNGYRQVFAGNSGRGTNAYDASVEGTGYLTYTVVSNSTYNVDDCLAYCDSIKGCKFVNLYYEFNNRLLDFVFHEKSNLKCAAYADIHNATEKTNFGGQQSYNSTGNLTYIQNSSGWAAVRDDEPPVPPGYDPVFGPTNGANNAPGYMGFTFIDRYDVTACATLCNARDPDPKGGVCQYFNIWRALVNGIPTTYTCSFYYLPTDESTAVNYGQGDLKVTLSRGYRRHSFVPDGSFEGYTCPNGESFCYTPAYDTWIGTSPAHGTLDATIFSYSPRAHSGKAAGLLGSVTGADDLSGTLSLYSPLQTVPGSDYVLTYFLASEPAGEQGVPTRVEWNGDVVQTIRPGFSDQWEHHQVTVKARGEDRLAFTGGAAPAWSLIDDVNLFALS